MVLPTCATAHAKRAAIMTRLSSREVPIVCSVLSPLRQFQWPRDDRALVINAQLLHAQFRLLKQFIAVLCQFHTLFVILQGAFKRHLSILQSCYSSFELCISLFKS